VVALLDQTQAAALPTLPFAAQLKVVAQSPPLPVAIMAIVDSRVPAARAKSLQSALLKMGRTPAGAEALAPLRLQGFIMPEIPGPAPKP
jgi:ABC-type phosphate/phosphonate transport system substrate-binding protein